MDSTIGMRIKQLREAKQMSVADFAKAAGVKPSAIYGLEGGANKPSIETVAMLRKSFPDLNTEWLQFGDGSMYKGAELTPTAAPTSTKEETPQEPEPVAEVPTLSPAVRRKAYRPIMSADPDLSHLSPEQQAEYWKKRHDRLLAEQASDYESQVHQETLRLINFPNASSDTAALYAIADSLAIDYPCISAESLAEVRSLPKFTPRLIPMRPVVTGFQTQALAGR